MKVFKSNKKFLLIIAAICTLAITSVNLPEIQKVEASNPYCADDDGDKCKVYGTIVRNCDEHETDNGCKSGSNDEDEEN